MTTSNIRYAIRSLAKSPVFTAVAALSLALALAVNTTMFALVDAVLHPTVPYHDGGRAYTISFLPGGRNPPSMQERFNAVRGGLRSAEHVLPYYLTWTTIERGNAIEDELVANAPLELLDVLGMRPETGRAFNESDTRPGAFPVVMISHE